MHNRRRRGQIILLTLLLLPIAAPAQGQAAERRTVVVTVDRTAYQPRDVDLLEDQAEDAAQSQPFRADIMGGDTESTVTFHDLTRDAPFKDEVEKRFGTDPKYAVDRTPALSVDISYSHKTLKTLKPAALDRDIGNLRNYVIALRPTPPGLEIVSEAEGGATVRMTERPLRDEEWKTLNTMFDVTPITKTSWHVALKKELLGYMSPARRLISNKLIDTMLRESLGDPLGFEPQKTEAGIAFTISNPDRHRAFIEALDKGFAQNPDFVLTTHPALVMHIALKQAAEKADQGEAFPSVPPLHSFELMSEVEDLANPPVDVTVVGNAVSVRARDPAHNADRAEIVRQALAGRSDIVITTQADQSLLISLASGVHLVPPRPPVSPERLMRAVRARVKRAKLDASDFFAAGEDKVSVRFADADDAAAFRGALSEPAGVTIRMVDDTKSKPGNKKFVLPTGETIWVRPEAIITGDMIADASTSVSRFTNEPVIEFRLTEEGRIRFTAATWRNVGQRFAIIIDGVAVEAAVIREPIMGGNGEISGNFTTESAEAFVESILAHKDEPPLKTVDEPAVR